MRQRRLPTVSVMVAEILIMNLLVNSRVYQLNTFKQCVVRSATSLSSLYHYNKSQERFSYLLMSFDTLTRLTAV